MKIADALIARTTRRPPGMVIGGLERPYLHRWYLIPRNNVFNVYLHRFLRDDDDRALHDHPWFWCSIILRGLYREHTIDRGGIHRRRLFAEGSIRFHMPWFAHRLELVDGAPCWTLFITFARIRNWGFHCPERWVRWESFTAADDPGAIGKGCDA